MLHVKFSSQPFDKLPAQCAVITVFADQRPFQGNAALLDWRLNGRLSRLAMENRFTGDFHEVLLMPAEGRIQSERILVFGLGNQKSFNESMLSNFVYYFLEKVEKKKVKDFLLSFSDLIASQFEWRNGVRLLVSRLRELPHVETIVLTESDERIREAKRRHMDFGMNVEVSFEHTN